MITSFKKPAGSVWIYLAVALGIFPRLMAESAPIELGQFQAQNHNLQLQVQEQQKQIDELRQRLDALQGSSRAEPSPASVRTQPEPAVSAEAPTWRAAREIRVSGEAGLGYFSSGSAGAYPNNEFRLDEARIFLEAAVWKNVYFYTGMEFATRESEENNIRVGELYADVEDVLTAGRDRRLSLRVGRFNIPFGVEYQYRSVLTNPLITHSVADIWGIDEGVQLYGVFGPVTYNLAVQNGGNATRRDYQRDKSLAARVGFQPTKSLSLSASAYRTGKLDSKEDYASELWFGGGFFTARGPSATTPTFQVELYELDAQWQWEQGHIKAASGSARFSDTSTTGNNSRHLHYFSLELEQLIVDHLYGAARYGAVRVADGYPLVGLGDFGKYYFASPPTEELHRLSLGLGYRFSAALIWKLEYSWENGRLINGAERKNEDLFSTELGLKF